MEVQVLSSAPIAYKTKPRLRSWFCFTSETPRSHAIIELMHEHSTDPFGIAPHVTEPAFGQESNGSTVSTPLHDASEPDVDPVAIPESPSDWTDTDAQATYLADMSENYHDFWEVAYGDRPKRKIGNGASGTVYIFEHESKEYAVKYGGINSEVIEGFRRGATIENVAHLKGVSLEDDVAVMDLLPGVRTDKMLLKDKMSIPNGHISKLIRTVLEMHQAGLSIDFSEANNINYDAERGYTVFDYLPRPIVTPEDSANEICLLSGALTASLAAPDAPLSWDASYMRNEEAMKVSLLNRFLDVLEAEYPDVIRYAAKVQQHKNQDPNTYGGGQIYDVYTLPHGEEFDKFKERVIRLGLEGREPDAYLASAIETQRRKYD